MSSSSFIDEGCAKYFFDLVAKANHHRVLIGTYTVPEAFDIHIKTQIKFSIISSCSSQIPGQIFIDYLDSNLSLVSSQRLKFYCGTDIRLITLDINPPSNHNLVIRLSFYFDKDTTSAIKILNLRVAHGMSMLYLLHGDQTSSVQTSPYINWRQSDKDLILDSFLGSFYMNIPLEWQIAEIPRSALQIAEYLLFNPIKRYLGIPLSDINTDIHETNTNPSHCLQHRALLSFSFGEDSTAAASILPADTIKYYCRRDYDRYYLPSGAEVSVNPYTIYHTVAHRVNNLIVINNNLEKIGLMAGMRHGFRHGFGYGAIGVILASILKCKSLAFGSVLEQVYLKSGTNYTDIHSIKSSQYNIMRRLFSLANIDFTLPTGGLSETLTSYICEHGPLACVSFSCPNIKSDGISCGKCFKCFRKQRLKHSTLAALTIPSNDVRKVLEKRPLKSATSVIYACKLANDFAYINDYVNTDVSFVERYYQEGLNMLIPGYLITHCIQSLTSMGIKPMSEGDVFQMKNIGRVLDPVSFSPKRAGLEAVTAME